MKYLLQEDGLQALEAFALGSTLVVFDYDGTLAPIVENPSDAFMRSKTEILLKKLKDKAKVGVISGRQLHDVKKFLNLDLDFAVGNHGMEGLSTYSTQISHASQVTQSWEKALKPKLANVAGTFIENKKFSLSIHYRKSEDRKAAKTKILELVSILSPQPRIILGKCVVNLVMAGAPHKGVALLEMMEQTGCRSAVYFGDDDNDEDVFSLAEDCILSVKVGKDPLSRALFYIHDQEEIDTVISTYLKFLESKESLSIGENF